MDKQKFKINMIDFIPNYKKVEVGKYEDGTPACLGDTVNHNNQNWIIAYRYGEVMLKQVGMMAMIGLEGFKNQDFSKVKKTNILGVGDDWLIIGYVDEPMYERLNEIMDLKD
jgi:hypothetical protein